MKMANEKEVYPMEYKLFGVRFNNRKERKRFERRTYLTVFFIWLVCLISINGLFALIYEVFLK